MRARATGKARENRKSLSLFPSSTERLNASLPPRPAPPKHISSEHWKQTLYHEILDHSMENSAFVTITKLKAGKKKNDQLIWNPDEGEGGRGRYSKTKIEWRCTASFPKTLTLFMTKICDFPNPINDLTKSLIPIYSRCGWQCCSIQNLWMAVVDGVMDNDERVASSKKNILLTLKTRVQKPYPIYGQNDNINTLFINKTGWKTIAFGSALVSLAAVFSLVTRCVTRLKTAATETRSAHVLCEVGSC